MRRMRHDTAVVVFARAPIPGQTKTRLIPALGAASAAELYRCFLLDTLGCICGVEAEVIVAAAEPEHLESIRGIAGEACPRAQVVAQSGSDLGERMANAFRDALAAGHARVALIGTDSPSLPPDRVNRALSLLRDRPEVVLGPSLDGGYYLIGLRAALPQLFQHMDWSSGTVLVDTLRRTQAIRAAVSLLEPWYDVDTPEALAVLRAHLTALALAGEPIPCPATWQYLQDQLPEH